MMIPVFKPSYDHQELEALREPFESGWIGLGPKTKEFEERFAAFLGIPYAVGVNSATAALHLALKVADVEGAEVITTPMTFISTNHAILYCNGVPVFADIEPDTLNIDPDDVERKVTSRTKAIVVVHYGGHACNMDRILGIARKHGLRVIEDAAHACGGQYRGRMLGTLGDFGCFSFHAVKNLATGDGGMITTREAEADARLRRLRWLGISKGTWDRVEGKGYSWEYNVEELGFKCHMNDITAAIGLVQLSKLEHTNARRRYLAERYTRLLADVDWIETPVEKEYTRSAWHNYVIKVADPADRDPLMEHLKARGISTGMHYIPNHLYEMYRPYVKEPLPVAETVWKRLITLPLFPDLTDEQQDHIVASIKNYRTG
jgi:perosamine synthetase